MSLSFSHVFVIAVNQQPLVMYSKVYVSAGKQRCHFERGLDYRPEKKTLNLKDPSRHMVEVEVESMDKAGNFIGWLHIEGLNLSVALVENALSKVHFTAERSAYYKTLVSAEEACRQRKEKILSICVFGAQVNLLPAERGKKRENLARDVSTPTLPC
ncbi:hypothetical protein PAMA_013277 [Pampus argenteus]